MAADLAALLREAMLLRLRAALDERANSVDPPGADPSAPAPAATGVAVPSLAVALLAARRKVGASGLRHRWVSCPTTRWADVGGYAAAKQQLQRAVEWPKQFKVEFARLSLTPPRGLLLHGPPGCAKTLLVKAVACASGATFVSLSAADVYSPMVCIIYEWKKNACAAHTCVSKVRFSARVVYKVPTVKPSPLRAYCIPHS